MAPAPCNTLRCNSPCRVARPGSCGQCGPARLGRHPLLTNVASCLPIPAPSSGRGSADSCPRRSWLSRSLAQIPRRGRHNECGSGASYCTTSVGRARPTGHIRRMGRARPGFWWGDSGPCLIFSPCFSIPSAPRCISPRFLSGCRSYHPRQHRCVRQQVRPAGPGWRPGRRSLQHLARRLHGFLHVHVALHSSRSFCGKNAAMSWGHLSHVVSVVTRDHGA